MTGSFVLCLMSLCLLVDRASWVSWCFREALLHLNAIIFVEHWQSLLQEDMSEGMQPQPALSLSQGPKFTKQERISLKNKQKISIDWHLGSLQHHSGNVREQK